MAVEARDIIFFGSANMQETDSGTQGGVIDRDIKMIWSDLQSNDTIDIVSDAVDTGDEITVYGRNASGALVSEAIAYGATGAITFERILKATVTTGTPAGTMAAISTTAFATGSTQAGGGASGFSVILAAGASSTDDYYKGMVFVLTGAHASQGDYREIVKYDGTTKEAFLRTAVTAQIDSVVVYDIHEGMTFEYLLGPVAIQNSVTECRRPFYNTAADPDTTKDYYEKIFVFNLNDTTTLSNATINEQDTGLYTYVHYAIAVAFGDDDSQTSTNRITAPGGGIGAWKNYSDGDIALPNDQNFTNEDGCAIWIHLDLAAGDTAQNSFYEMQVKGQTV